jgi:hypothetical protein
MQGAGRVRARGASEFRPERAGRSGIRMNLRRDNCERPKPTPARDGLPTRASLLGGRDVRFRVGHGLERASEPLRSVGSQTEGHASTPFLQRDPQLSTGERVTIRCQQPGRPYVSFTVVSALAADGYHLPSVTWNHTFQVSIRPFAHLTV